VVQGFPEWQLRGDGQREMELVDQEIPKAHELTNGKRMKPEG
jgi:hypothetical protein